MPVALLYTVMVSAPDNVYIYIYNVVKMQHKKSMMFMLRSLINVNPQRRGGKP